MKKLDEIFNDWDEEEFEENESLDSSKQKQNHLDFLTEFDEINNHSYELGGTGSGIYINNTTTVDYTISTELSNISTSVYNTGTDNYTISSNSYTYDYTYDSWQPLTL